ncbi:MAG: ester cyclase [Chloroflexota bacterium]|nr:ester cyclase [Chloroflexota bacterium]
MTIDANRALVERFVTEIFAGGNVDAIDELVAPTFTSPTFGITEDGPSRLRAATERVHASLEDVAFTIDDMVAEDDRVAARLTSSGTPTGEWMGIQGAAGRRYTISEAHFFQIADGRIVAHWHLHDAMNLLKQLGGS